MFGIRSTAICQEDGVHLRRKVWKGSTTIIILENWAIPMGRAMMGMDIWDGRLIKVGDMAVEEDMVVEQEEDMGVEQDMVVVVAEVDLVVLEGVDMEEPDITMGVMAIIMGAGAILWSITDGVGLKSKRGGDGGDDKLKFKKNPEGEGGHMRARGLLKKNFFCCCQEIVYMHLYC